ncbi:MAG: hypothetical protein DLM69_02735 [Candidatus Chloroheliales bacterium]|nr:MAG: hypothetical protein DLM69_02735 [Chloroflexota bacterium]
MRRGYEDRVKAVFDHWELHSDIVGETTADGLVRVLDNGEEMAVIPARILTDEVPIYHRVSHRPAYLDEEWAYDVAAAIPEPSDYAATLLQLLARPNLASKAAIYEQYDKTIMSNTVLTSGEGDAAVIRLKDWGSRKGLAFKTDCNATYCYLDPYRGGQLAVAEAARNVVVVGATPLALTDCLNFGSPERPEIFYQFEQCVRGLADACRALNIPVIGGNVSLYNETSGVAVYPTPVVGMAGLLEDAGKAIGLALRNEGDVIALLGPTRPMEGDGLGGNEYATMMLGALHGRPSPLDADLEAKVQKAYLQAAEYGIIRAAHDVSDGGIVVALAEMCLASGYGIDLNFSFSEGLRQDAALFGEWPSRIICELDAEGMRRLHEIAATADVPFTIIGTVSGRGSGISGATLSVGRDEMVVAWGGTPGEI